jgi:predicted esterase YcpF (UPF0227 family)
MESHPNPHDDFLQAGGNSVLALQLVSELEEVLGSSAHTGLVGSLLGGSTFEECCAYLSSKFQRKLGSSSVDAAEPLIQKEEFRRKLNSLHNRHSVKRVRLEQVEISAVESTEVQKVDCDKNVLYVSSCRGKTEGDGAWTEACILSSLNSIQLKVTWRYNLEKCVDASPRYIKYRR